MSTYKLAVVLTKNYERMSPMLKRCVNDRIRQRGLVHLTKRDAELAANSLACVKGVRRVEMTRVTHVMTVSRGGRRTSRS